MRFLKALELNLVLDRFCVSDGRPSNVVTTLSQRMRNRKTCLRVD